MLLLSQKFLYRNDLKGINVRRDEVCNVNTVSNIERMNLIGGVQEFKSCALLS